MPSDVTTVLSTSKQTACAALTAACACATRVPTLVDIERLVLSIIALERRARAERSMEVDVQFSSGASRYDLMRISSGTTWWAGHSHSH